MRHRSVSTLNHSAICTLTIEGIGIHVTCHEPYKSLDNKTKKILNHCTTFGVNKKLLKIP